MSTLSYAAVVRDIKRQINELMGIAEKEINDNDLLVENLGATSIVVLQLYLTCQEKYDVRLADDLDLIEPIAVCDLARKILIRFAAKETQATQHPH